jgi:hypothetical protein
MFPYIYTSVVLHSFLNFWVSIYSHLPPGLKIPFSIFVEFIYDELGFGLSENGFISLSSLKDIFTYV